VTAIGRVPRRWIKRQVGIVLPLASSVVLAACSSPALSAQNASANTFLLRLRSSEGTMTWRVDANSFGVAVQRVSEVPSTIEVLDASCNIVDTFQSGDGGMVAIALDGSVTFAPGPQRLGDSFALPRSGDC
jgi:hypothetical protein